MNNFDKIPEPPKFSKEYIEDILKRRGIERDKDDRLILYHVTTADKLAKITLDAKIKPRISTGEKSWTVSKKEEEDPQKASKIYLGSRNFVKTPEMGLVFNDGGRAFTLEVKVDDKNLTQDEDSHADNWVDSIDFLGSCGYLGEISDFKVVSVGPTVLPHDLRIKLLNDEGISDQEIELKVKEEQLKIEERENEILEKAGIKIEDLK